MTAEDDTVRMDLSEVFGPAPWSLAVNREDNEPVETVEPKVPEPALVRAVAVAALGFVSFVLGKSLSLEWIDHAMVIYSIAAPAVLGWWIRRHVSPVKK